MSSFSSSKEYFVPVASNFGRRTGGTEMIGKAVSGHPKLLKLTERMTRVTFEILPKLIIVWATSEDNYGFWLDMT